MTVSYRKPALVTLTVAAGLVAIAPFASANQSHHDSPRPAAPSSTCSAQGGAATADNRGSGEGLVGAVAQAPVGGANVGNLLCNSILNDNLSMNRLTADVL
ncbi:hypothetical protein [Actinomycetospora sp. NBRC 106378]|jgi:hypothetical protein|uniref:hypothetical protein n=1 Tax=Actinomycetospora sp. NBRC 106378 TaxID=3032208 RepID=UPI0025571690|nr:hypothetical protein [Actinomycetospora sp. NBRC 106378]